jgi:hypothetical protein
MKSLIMNNIFRDPESSKAKMFPKDLKTFLSLEEEQKNTLVSGLVRIRIARTTNEENEIAKELASETNISIADAGGILALLEYLMNSFMDQTVPIDDHKEWVSDLKEASMLENAQEEKAFMDLISTIQVAIVSKVEPEVKRRRATQFVGPFLDTISVSVGVVPVIKNAYRYGDSLDNYEPEIDDTAIVCSVRLSLDEGIAKEVSFNVDVDVLDMTINTLMAAKKNIVVLQKFLKV